jgi:HD-GYP domain-containing protein (c-di-GMP phosphodiesterase class II)
MNKLSISSIRSSFKSLSIPAPLKIAILYLIIGALWILFSDEWLLLVTQNINSLSFLQTIKGWVYVLVTAGLLYFLIRRDFSTIQHSQQALQQSYDATLLGWVHALDLRDKETEGHTLRVTELTLRLAHEMGVGNTELEHVRRGALLHDIGKIGVPDRILLKPEALNDEEWEIMWKHPDYVYELLSPIAYLRPALDIPYCHHEKWDGTGYPRRLKGDQIPLAARIFAVVDVWDALQFDRPYRKAWPEKQMREYIQEQSGKHFDPQVVKIFLKLVSEQS